MENKKELEAGVNLTASIPNQNQITKFNLFCLASDKLILFFVDPPDESPKQMGKVSNKENTKGSKKGLKTKQKDQTETHEKNFSMLSKKRKETEVSCEICGNKYASMHSLDKHRIRVHLKEKKFKCDECGKRFVEKSDLDKHSVVHTKEKPYKCEKCGARFSLKSSWRRHTEQGWCKADREKIVPTPFKCNDCGKQFRHKYRLRDHKRVHTKEKPYECENCGKRFTRADNLNKHKKEICKK